MTPTVLTASLSLPCLRAGDLAAGTAARPLVQRLDVLDATPSLPWGPGKF